MTIQTTSMEISTLEDEITMLPWNVWYLSPVAWQHITEELQPQMKHEL